MKRNKRCFRLSHLGAIRSVQIDSVITDDTHDWQDIEVTLTTVSGGTFKVASIRAYNNGLIGESRMTGELVSAKSWEDREGDDLECPICLHQGHGAMACNTR